MTAEFAGELGRNFVNKVSLFLDGKFGFSVYLTAYEGPDAASIVVDGERIRFDLIMKQTRRETLQNQQTNEYRTHFFCECKWRGNPVDLKTKLKDFLKKALKTAPELQSRYSDNFCFMFICNKTFGVAQSNLESVEYLQDFLNGDCNLNDLAYLSRKVGILVLTDWFLETTSKGGI